MNSVITIALQIISFLVSHRADIVQVVKDIEALIPDAPGADKAAAVKGFIAGALGIETQLESSWVYVAPIFNAFVALIKGKIAAPTAATPAPAASS